MSALTDWEEAHRAWSLTWDEANPRPPKGRREAWAQKRLADHASYVADNPTPARTKKEEAALEPLRALHSRLGGKPG